MPDAVFIGLTTLSQVAGILAMALMGYWLSHYQQGFSWSYLDGNRLNYHPMFMTVGLIFLYGDAILIYRVFPKQKKIVIKVAHMLLQLAALAFASTALIAIFTLHRASNEPNLYSIHSWLGLGTFVLFGLQFVLGFVFYLFPTVAGHLRSAYMPLHRFWGLAIFCMAIATALMGIVSYGVENYSQRTKESYVFNFYGLSVIAFGLLVVYLVTKAQYKRPKEETYTTIQEAN